jgi:predicted DsbA family dithiol-disulfide isomerase
VRIDVWSDVVCPWCFLGKRRLDAALEGLGDELPDVEVHWRAYQLDPTAGPEPRDLKPAIERKYGPGAFESMTGRLTPLGADAGIDYRFDLVQRVSSVDALRLLAWAEETQGTDAAERLHERLFRAYFTEGGNIADRAALARWAAEAGFEEALAAEALAGGAGAESVHADLQAALERGITAVPSFVVEDRFLVPGAQDVETMQDFLRRVAAKLAV